MGEGHFFWWREKRSVKREKAKGKGLVAFVKKKNEESKGQASALALRENCRESKGEKERVRGPAEFLFLWVLCVFVSFCFKFVHKLCNYCFDIIYQWKVY